MMFAGLALANVLGVPFGTALGDAFGWRQTFWAVVAIGFVASFALYAWLPRDVPTPPMRLINDVLRVANFPLAFAIATVVTILLIVAIIVADRTLDLSRLFEDRGV